ncbi:hypothetical protein [Senegalia massiliensis]|uniref:Uncharacterized protein n=1 Tax=Senegalia massiliensis TaxID=1720316 RepID=A0A845R1Z1_9CLOT|nr:hypothetical protein [Senegalia massiliensis]NBI07558.1 hypothetical protein [Senegalia massiliensis]
MKINYWGGSNIGTNKKEKEIIIIDSYNNEGAIGGFIFFVAFKGIFKFFKNILKGKTPLQKLFTIMLISFLVTAIGIFIIIGIYQVTSNYSPERTTLEIDEEQGEQIDNMLDEMQEKGDEGLDKSLNELEQLKKKQSDVLEKNLEEMKDK